VINTNPSKKRYSIAASGQWFAIFCFKWWIL